MSTSLNLVVVEDSDDLRMLLKNALRTEGHHVVALSCAEELEDHSGIDQIDAFLIDINLPGEDGFSLAKRIRHVHTLAGIIMLTARSTLDDKLNGYDCGADIYLTKPVSLPELFAALRSFARRRMATLKQASPDSLVLNKSELHGCEGVVKLTPQETVVLTCMARAPACKLETWQFAELLHMELDEAFKANLAVRMVRLRKKMVDAGAKGTVIESLRNVGYQITTYIEII
ncbi:MAG: DNA-binding response regulator [Betaproteobacteria bacterium]|jgi:DNA-binding response OmpR family regulator|nr:DNA-binding response regulator [Betaproteobacteria bacterium]